MRRCTSDSTLPYSASHSTAYATRTRAATRKRGPSLRAPTSRPPSCAEPSPNHFDRRMRSRTPVSLLHAASSHAVKMNVPLSHSYRWALGMPQRIGSSLGSNWAGGTPYPRRRSFLRRLRRTAAPIETLLLVIGSPTSRFTCTQHDVQAQVMTDLTRRPCRRILHSPNSSTDEMDPLQNLPFKFNTLQIRPGACFR